jgi:hypothetical protein
VAVLVAEQPAATDSTGKMASAGQPASVAAHVTNTSDQVSSGPASNVSSGALSQQANAQAMTDGAAGSTHADSIAASSIDTASGATVVTVSLGESGSDGAAPSHQSDSGAGSANQFYRHHSIARPGREIDQDAMRASTMDWSRLIGSNAPQMKYQRATASAAWQLRRSQMSPIERHTKSASSKDTESGDLDGIGFMQLLHPHQASTAGIRHIATAGASH